MKITMRIMLIVGIIALFASYTINKDFSIMFVLILITLGAVLIRIFFPPSKGILPVSKSASGLSERTQVKTDKGNLDILLLSEDRGNPVLLVCGGGPGIPQYLLESVYPSPLVEEFTVCYWDYRGTGASFRPDTLCDKMTTERYIKDTVAITDYLRERFSTEKVFIMGHSFGTYLALKTVQAYPERYRCYIAMSQIVDQVQSEYLAFAYMKEQYEKKGKARIVKKFQRYNIRASEKDYDEYFFSGLRDKAMHELGLGTARSMHSVISGIFLPNLRCNAYTRAERINTWRGKLRARSFPVTKDALVFNAFEAVPRIEVPLYLVAGKYDYTCCASLQQAYYEYIEAPKKKMVIFANAAHSPFYEEYEEGKKMLSEIKNHADSPECTFE